jgi:hypothetical protein
MRAVLNEVEQELRRRKPGRLSHWARLQPIPFVLRISATAGMNWTWSEAAVTVDWITAILVSPAKILPFLE